MNTIIVTHVGGRPTATGRTDYIRIISVSENGGVFDATHMLAKVLGYRYNESHSGLSVSGYGYSKRDHIASYIRDMDAYKGFNVVIA